MKRIIPVLMMLIFLPLVRADLDRFWCEENVFLGDIVKFTGNFVNNENSQVLAKMHVDIYLKGVLVGSVESEQIKVKPKESVTLVAYFKPQVNGVYTARAFVIYDDKKTAIRITDFTVAVEEERPNWSWSSENVDVPLGIGFGTILIVIIGLGGMLFLTKFKKR